MVTVGLMLTSIPTESSRLFMAISKTTLNNVSHWDYWLLLPYSLSAFSHESLSS